MTAAPSPEVLKRLLRYEPDTGLLFWLGRDRCFFPTQRAASSWAARFEGKEAFARVSEYGYRVGTIFDRHYMAHRVIWAIMTGLWPEHQIDHINCDRADNRFCNLREATRSQNHCNRTLSVRSTTGVKGVCWDASRGKWMAHISLGGRFHNLGRFDDINAAAAAYAAASSNLHGEFGRVA